MRKIVASLIIAVSGILVSPASYTVDAAATGCRYTSTSYGAYAYCSGTDGWGNGNYFTVRKTCISKSGRLYYATAYGNWEHAGMGKASRAYCPSGTVPTQGSAWMRYKDTN